MPLSDRPRFSQLSIPRQALVRLCESINYGYIQDLLIEDREPVLDPGPVVLFDIKLDSEERRRPELDSADFLLCAEAIRFIVLLDRIDNGKISRLEVRAGIPRRILYEQRISSWEGGVAVINGNNANCPVVRQAGSKDPVRRLVVEIDGNRGGCGPSAGRAGMAAFGRTLSRREYPETTRVGDCFGSLGPAAGKRQLSQARQNSHRWASPKREDARESDRPMGHSRTRNQGLKVPCVSAPSLRSIHSHPERSEGGLVRAR